MMLRVVAMINNDGPALRVEAEVEGHVDETLVDFRGVDRFAGRERDR